MKQILKQTSIGMFDSGIGGLTVMKQILQLLPKESIVYFGDTARLPYGEKSRETIIRYSIENAIFLMEQHIKILVVACNTAASVSLEKLQSFFKIPIVGVINPGAQKAALSSKNGRIAVLGTKGTIASGAYQKEIANILPSAQIFPIACPLFVPLVEEKMASHPVSKIMVQEYLKPLKNLKIDTLLLGCTHYPFLKQLIQEEVGRDVLIVDSASTCAENVEKILKEKNLFQNQPHPPAYRFIVSDDNQKFHSLGEQFLGFSIPEVEVIRSNS
jgi:glutamate racemase